MLMISMQQGAFKKVIDMNIRITDSNITIFKRAKVFICKLSPKEK